MGMDTRGGPTRRGLAQPNMNVTPLVDVVLVLLIIFMVITPLLTTQFWLHMPCKPEQPAEERSDDDEQAVVVRVTATGDIRINRERIARQEFAAKLRRILAARQDRTVFFDAEDEALFGVAAEAMDLARGGGATTIAVVTEALKE